MADIRKWYNGYSWDGIQTVYNPYSILLFLERRRFGDHWFATGTPTMLIKLMREQEDFIFNNLTISGKLMDTYDLENLDLRTLLFQTGYLTVKKMDAKTGFYTLDYPNREVEESMSDYILGELLHTSYGTTAIPVHQIKDAFLENDLPQVIKIINALLKDVPYTLLKGKREDFYHAVVHLHFKYLGLLMESEVMTADGRMDVVVKTPTHIYVIEFKLNQSAEKAIAQIKEKGYAEKYSIAQKPIVLVGINFNSRKKAVGTWLAEPYL
jgi:hypothetical protein